MFILSVLSLLSLLAGETEAQTVGIQCFVPGECLDSQILDIAVLNNSKDCLHHCQVVMLSQVQTFPIFYSRDKSVDQLILRLKNCNIRSGLYLSIIFISSRRVLTILYFGRLILFEYLIGEGHPA